MRNLYYYSSRFFSFSMKMRNWYQNISKYLFSMCTYWFPQLLPPPILSENEKYIQHLTDKFKHMLLKNDDGFKELLNNNIELYIQREKYLKPKWYDNKVIWFASGIITAVATGKMAVEVLK